VYIVEFKAGRTDLYYVIRVAGDETSAVDNNTNNNNGSNENEITLAIGTHVIVDADRGNDLGRIASLPFSINIILETLRNIIHTQAQNNRNNPGGGNDEHESSSPLQQPSKGGQSAREPHIKHVARVASQQEVFALQAKLMDEEKALTAAQYRARYKKLPMEVVNAEFQWDRNKLTYYYYTIGGQRVDFRDLVRELFKLYKTRIWMFDVSS
ncbi:PSP1-domain-containing protein, partial [Ramicandelaber brevisporus]